MSESIMICDKSNRHRKLVSKVFRMFGKKKSRLYGLVSATFILGQIILPSTSFATELDFEGYASYEDATEEGAKSLGGKLATGFNWENASGAILSALGGVPVPGSTTAKYTFQAFGCGGFAICRMSPSDVEMNQKYSAQCAFVGTGAAYPIPPVYWVHGIAKGGTNETKPMATTLWHPGGPHHPPYICGGIIAKISFSAYEGANGIGPADAEAGTIGDMTELEQSPDKETGEVGDFEIGDANFDSEKYTNCIYDKCIGDTGNADDDASHQEEGAYYHHQLDFVFEILDNHSFTISIIYNTLLIIPCVDTFACCATPSPKLRVENAVSPSGIIHAARSGTRFRHLSATMLAAIR